MKIVCILKKMICFNGTSNIFLAHTAINIIFNIIILKAGVGCDRTDRWCKNSLNYRKPRVSMSYVAKGGRIY